MYQIKRNYINIQEGSTNQEFSAAQRYKKITTLPPRKMIIGGGVLTPGACFGLSLSWLKSVAVSGCSESLPRSNNHHGVNDGLLTQYLYTYGFNSSNYYDELCVAGHCDESIQREVVQDAHREAVLEAGFDDEKYEGVAPLTGHLEWMGWRVLHSEQLFPFHILMKLDALDWMSLHLFLVSLPDHIGAIAIYDELLSFYDPNIGILTYSKDEAIGNMRLMSTLNSFIGEYAVGKLKITYLNY
ncbi:hypothetical protein [Aeromonas sp. SG16]|uniref:hypothetical protein n=1 Tax=Aeromonas sp. SG16 TaxID=2950548 RepID=UPI00210893A0|nr:hypothetical protein [Aeromonas sp. SG16]MCQ4054451.1 hypothetical protein [Aeromonas sp. SG16]